MKKTKCAIFVDGENISRKRLLSALQSVDEKFEIIVCYIFFAWNQNNFNAYKEPIQAYPIKISIQNGENHTDEYLIMSASEYAITNKNIQNICIVSSDSDFRPLVVNLRSKGKNVLGFGVKSRTRETYINSFDKYFFIDDNFNQRN